MKTIIIATLIAATVAGCATRGANYVPLVDMQGKDALMFAADTAECQRYAQQRLDAASGAVVGAIAGALFMAVLMPRGYRNDGAQQGAIIGGASGAVSANDTQETITKRCLAGRGYNVLN